MTDTHAHSHVCSLQMISDKPAVQRSSFAVCRSTPLSCVNFLEQNSTEQYVSEQLGENPQSHRLTLHTLPDNNRELNIVSSLYPNPAEQSE